MKLKIENHPKSNLLTFLKRPYDALKVNSLNNTYYFSNGRSAIYNGLQLLKQDTRNEILVPSYHCGEEIEALAKRGYKLIFYNINKCCEYDIENIKSLINTETLAIYTIHYNGHLEDLSEIRKLCNISGIYLIEDCAQILGPHTDKSNAGLVGDISIFSPRKFLPVINGGILVLNDKKLNSKFNRKCNNKINFSNEIKLTLTNWLRDHIIGNYAEAKESIKKVEGNNAGQTGSIIHDFKTKNYNCCISTLSKYLIRRFNFDEICFRRRSNYMVLYNTFENMGDITCVQKKISINSCPLYFLIDVEEPWKFGDYLLKNGIASTVFWSWFHESYPRESFSDSTYLKNHVLGLPVHQSLTKSDMDYIVLVIKDYREKNFITMAE